MTPSHSSSSSLRFPTWQREYEALLFVVTAADALSKCLEVAEGAILSRREALAGSSDHHCERKAMDTALANLHLLKSKVR